MQYLPNKFPYQNFGRTTENGKRLYLTPDGNKLPSVTTILDKTKPAEAKQKLNEWKARVSHVKAEAIKTEASSRGTRMHKFLEDYVTDGKLAEPGTNPYSIQSHRMAFNIIDSEFKNVDAVYGNEISLYFPGIYAGTTDVVLTHKGILTIGDYKQTDKPKKREWIGDYFLQLAAYAEAHNEVYGTNIQNGLIMMCSSAFEYQDFLLTGDEFEKYRQMWWKRVEQYYLANP